MSSSRAGAPRKAINGYRVCTHCGESKRESTGVYLQRRADGECYDSSCKPCCLARMKKRRQTMDQEAKRKSDKHQDVKKLYGITLADYERMYVEQNGVCAICENPTTDGRRLHVDHNHNTGQVRALLCSNCNIALGHLRDSPYRLSKAIDYLFQYDDAIAAGKPLRKPWPCKRRRVKTS